MIVLQSFFNVDRQFSERVSPRRQMLVDDDLWLYARRCRRPKHEPNDNERRCTSTNVLTGGTAVVDG
jgi:hypothetical protein